MSDNPSPFPIPEDLVIDPAHAGAGQPAEAMPRITWDEVRGRYRLTFCVMVVDQASMMFAVPGAKVQAAIVPMEADGTLAPEKCRAALVEVGGRKRDDA